MWARNADRNFGIISIAYLTGCCFYGGGTPMRSVLLSSAVVLALAITLLAQAAPPQSTPKQELCAVAGRVVTAAEGTPLRSARVLLIAERSGSQPRTYAAETDGSGAFVLKSVVPGRYTFFAEHTGYVSQQYRSLSAASGAVLALHPGQQLSGVLFRLILAAVVTGRITDQDEEPMVGIQVMALRRPTEDEIEDEAGLAARKQDQLLPAGSAQTDDRGQYRIFGLAPGDYYLKATESLQPNYSPAGEYFALQSLGVEYAPVYYPGVLQRSQAETVSLRPGDEAQVDFSMRHFKTVAISGRVLALDGKPASAMVELRDAEDYTDDRNTITDAEGKFQLKGVPPGSYVLMAYQESSDNRYRPTARQELQVGNQNIDSLTIALTRGVDFDGRLTVEGPSRPLSDRVHVSLFSNDNDMDFGTYGALVKPDGSFEIKGVHEGKYTLQVYGGSEGDWYIKSARLGSDDVLEHGLQVEKGTAGTLEIIISKASAQLEGSVVQDDKPAIAARVRIVPDPSTPYNRIRRRDTTTDQNGMFVFSGLPPGNYRVIARAPAVPGAEGATAEPQSVTLAEHEHKAVQLKLVPAQDQ